MSTPPSTRSRPRSSRTASCSAFGVDDVQQEYERLRGLGVHFTQEPAATGPVTTAVLDDACGDLIQTAAQETTG
jgi:Glyoxalase/Bleomycin resistance protein/Dioxygenase superfamily